MNFVKLNFRMLFFFSSDKLGREVKFIVEMPTDQMIFCVLWTIYDCLLILAFTTFVAIDSIY